MLVEVLDGESAKIEKEKLRAIGQRNRAEMEADSQRHKQATMTGLIAEERAEREQKALIEKLKENETPAWTSNEP